MKKSFSLLLATSMMATMMVGCSSTPAETTPAATEETPAVSVDPVKTGLKIAIISSPSGVDDGSFNQDNYIGVLRFIEEYPDATVTAIREENSANAVQAVADIVADYDVLVCCGFQFAGISTLAQENPEKNFILVDSEPSNPDGSFDPYSAENIYSMCFADQESGFMAGLAAALETQTNKVAVVNGVAYPSNVNYQYGFESGVNYANAKLGTAVEIVELPSYAGTDVTNTNVGGNYIGSFDDEATGKVVGEALISQGVDILFVAAGGAGNGVFTAAKETDSAMVIGCDVDQYDDGEAGTRNIIMTSALKVMSLNVYRQLVEIENGTFSGYNATLFADTESTGYVNAEGRHQLSDETVATLDELLVLMANGEITPAANFNGYLPESFPGLD